VTVLVTLPMGEFTAQQWLFILASFIQLGQTVTA